MAQIILQKYANREIRLGFQNIAISSKNKGDKAEQKNIETFGADILESYVSHQNSLGGYELKFDRRGCAVAVPYTAEQDAKVQARLDIIGEIQRRALKRAKRGGWGFKPKPTEFTKNARHRLLEAGSVMDSLVGRNCVEVTVTLPGSTLEALEVVSVWSGWIMNRITQLIRRYDGVTAWFYVWELQKRGALHLHFALGARTLTEAKTLAHEIEQKWFEVLLELRDKTGVDAFARWYGGTWRSRPEKWKSHVAPIWKSVAAYFSKYCGKQARPGGKVANRFFPARWWGSSRSIKQGIKNERYSKTIELRLSDVGPALQVLRELVGTGKAIRHWRYDFDLGKSASGTVLGGGWREISYFDSERFRQISEVISALGDYVAQTWGLYADMEKVTQTLQA